MSKQEQVFEAVLNKVGDVSPKAIAMIEVMIAGGRSVKDIVKAVKVL